MHTEARGKARAAGRAEQSAAVGDAPSVTVRLHSEVKHGKPESLAAKHASKCMHAGCSVKQAAVVWS